jgi:sucrose-6-phosphate hydrolase SacC (GH32 family)
VRLVSRPVAEVGALRGAKLSFRGALRPGENPLADLRGELFDANLKIAPRSAKTLVLDVRGTPIEYDVKTKRLSVLGASAAVELVDGCLDLRVLVDRSSIEIFTGDGRANMAFCFLPSENDRSLGLRSEGGDAEVRALDIWELKSTWPKP